MRLLREIATLFVLGPLIGVAITVFGMLRLFNEIAIDSSTVQRDLGLILSSTSLGVVAFVFGVVLHAILAKKTGCYSNYTWRLMLTMSIVLCFLAFPIGVVMLVLLFTLETFKKMRTTNRSVVVD
jgi:hypothetical protein